MDKNIKKIIKNFIENFIKKFEFIGRFKNATRVLYTFKFQLYHDLHNSQNLSITLKIVSSKAFLRSIIDFHFFKLIFFHNI